ncbi:MAG: protein kinase [Zavarzinella sp.]
MNDQNDDVRKDLPNPEAEKKGADSSFSGLNDQLTTDLTLSLKPQKAGEDSADNQLANSASDTSLEASTELSSDQIPVGEGNNLSHTIDFVHSDQRPKSEQSELTFAQLSESSDHWTRRFQRSAASPLPTAGLEGYEILSELGRGGMGIVYLARQPKLNRLVALKMILSGEHASNTEHSRFLREAQAIASLHHPNIVQVFEVGEAQGRPYLVLEYVAGGSLASRLDGQPWPSRAAAELIQTIARAMHYAHQRGIIHRDLKPANVLLGADSGSYSGDTGESLNLDHTAPIIAGLPFPDQVVPKITDFGLAKRYEEVDEDGTVVGQTRTGAVVGTPSYIAPEQAAGKNRGIGPGVDIYALGAVLYELLTGRPPFRGETPLDTVLQVMADDPVPPSKLRSKLPRDLETICLKCLQKSPAKRYATAEELADDLQRFILGEPVSARPISVRERAIKWVKRHTAATVLIATSVVTFLVLLIVSIYFNFRLQNAADQISLEADQARQAQAQLRLEKSRAEEKQKEAENLRAIAVAESIEANKQRELVEKEKQNTERERYALQLFKAAALAERNPQRALRLLEDRTRCPDSLRDFAWEFLRSRCQVTQDTIGKHDQPITQVAYSPSGELIASASWDNVVRIWDVKRHQAIFELRGHRGIVMGVQFINEQVMVTASNDNSIRLWKLPQRGNQLKIVSPSQIVSDHRDSIKSLVISPDRKQLASGDAQGTIRLWDVVAPNMRRNPNWQLVANGVLQGHRGTVWSLAWSIKGLFSGGEDRSVRSWDLISLRSEELFRMEFGIISLAASPDGELLAAADKHADDPSIQLWRLSAQRTETKLRGHTGTIYGVSFSDDSARLASVSADGTTRLWDVANKQERAIFEPDRRRPGNEDEERFIRSVSFCPDGINVATGGIDGVIRVWGYIAQRDSRLELEVPGPFRAAEISQDGSTMAVIDKAGRVHVWVWNRADDFVSTTPTFSLRNFAGESQRLALNADGTKVAVYSQGESVRVWDTRSLVKKEPSSVLIPRCEAIAMAFHGDQFVVIQPNHTIRCYNQNNLKIRYEATTNVGKPSVLAFSTDGTKMVTAGTLALQIWDAQTGKELYSSPTAHFSPIVKLAVVPGSTTKQWTIASGDERGIVRLWDIQPSGIQPKGSLLDQELKVTERFTLNGIGETVHTMFFTSEGKSLITAGNDRLIRVWDPEIGQERASLAGHTNAIYAATIQQWESQRLISLDQTGMIRIWQTAR